MNLIGTLKAFGLLSLVIVCSLIVLASIMGNDQVDGIKQLLETANANSFLASEYAGYVRGYLSLMLFVSMMSALLMCWEQYNEA